MEPIIEYKNKNKEDWYLISWVLSNKSNYRCSYCPDILHNGSTGQPAWQDVKNFIENFYVKKEVCFRVSGGEPTYWKHFVDMAKCVKDSGHTFSFVTNASRPVDYWHEINPYTDGVFLSYHDEYSSVAHFVEVCNSLDCPVAVSMMLLPDNFDDILSKAYWIYENTKDNVTIVPKVIVDKVSETNPTNKVYSYTDQQKNVIANWPYQRQLQADAVHRGPVLFKGIETDPNEIILKGDNNFIGLDCYGGIDGLNVDMWGDIYRVDCAYGGKLGSIREYKLPTSPIVCGKSVCSCLSDLYLRKL